MAPGDENPNGSVLVAVQIQLGEIKGILNTYVSEHARRLSDQEGVSRQLRTDLTAVNAELTTKVTAVNTQVTTNIANIAELRGDVSEVKEKQNSQTNRVLAVIAGIVGAASLLWNVIGK